MVGSLTHRLDFLNYIAKDSGLSKKGTMIGSYFKHKLKGVLTAAGRSISFMLTQLGYNTISTDSVQNVKRQFGVPSRHVEDIGSRGKAHFSIEQKVDFNNFSAMSTTS